MTDVLLTPQFLSSLVSDKRVQDNFPYLKEKYTELSRRKQSCRGGLAQPDARVLEQVKQFVMSMPGDQKDRLIQITGLKADTVFIAFARDPVSNRIKRVTK